MSAVRFSAAYSRNSSDVTYREKPSCRSKRRRSQPQGADPFRQGQAWAIELRDARRRQREDRTVAPNNNSKRARALWGTTRSCLANIVSGVSQGFTRRLEISGVGYRAAVQGKTLVLQLGFSHDVNFAIPEGLTVKCEKPTSIEITGFDKQVIGQFAAEIRALRPPEPYKGKGIRYEGESILRKEGKKK